MSLISAHLATVGMIVGMTVGMIVVAPITPAPHRVTVTRASREQMSPPALLINLGSPREVPEAVRADQIAALMPKTCYRTVPDAAHFSFLAQCSTLGRISISLAGEEGICVGPGGRDRGEIHAELKQLTGDFLKGQFALE